MPARRDDVCYAMMQSAMLCNMLLQSRIWMRSRVVRCIDIRMYVYWNHHAAALDLICQVEHRDVQQLLYSIVLCRSRWASAYSVFVARVLSCGSKVDAVWVNRPSRMNGGCASSHESWRHAPSTTSTNTPMQTHYGDEIKAITKNHKSTIWQKTRQAKRTWLRAHDPHISRSAETRKGAGR